MMRRRRTSATALTALTWGLVVLTLSPIAFMVAASLSDYQDVVRGAVTNADGGWHPKWSNYREMWVDVDFLAFLRNSLVICGLTTLFSTALASCAAYALARFSFRGATLFRLMVLLTRAFPVAILALPLTVGFIRLGLYDTPLGRSEEHTSELQSLV